MPESKSRQQPEQKSISQSSRARPLSQDAFERQELPPAQQAALFLQRTLGNRATAALIQRQDNEGSLTMAGSASADETAADTGSYTQELAADEQSSGTPGERELGESMEEEALTTISSPDGSSRGFRSQHPSLAQLGIRPKEIKGNKVAAYIGNSDYKHNINWNDLPGAKADAETMKGVMEGHQYKTLTHSEDKTSTQIDSIFKGAIGFAGAGDALLLYYAGHGLPEGMAGIDSHQADLYDNENQEGSGDEERGFKKGAGGVELGGDNPAPESPTTNQQANTISEGMPDITDIEPYSTMMGHLESGVAKGVHTTFISDACHSGAAADLVRVKAEEKLAESKNDKVGAISEQIKRLEDLKSQIPAGQGDQIPVANESFWENFIRPELKAVEVYLKEAGVEVTIPHVPTEYSRGALEQPINLVINALIDLGEQLREATEESTLEKAA